MPLYFEFYNSIVYVWFPSNTDERTQRWSSQISKENLRHFMEGQTNKRRGQGQNWTTHYGWHTQRKKTPLAWTCDTNGSPASHIRGQLLHWEVPGFKRGPGRPRTNWSLEEHSQQGLVKDGDHLAGSRGDSSKQIRMASIWMRVESRSRSTYVITSVTDGRLKPCPHWRL